MCRPSWKCWLQVRFVPVCPRSHRRVRRFSIQGIFPILQMVLVTEMWRAGFWDPMLGLINGDRDHRATFPAAALESRALRFIYLFSIRLYNHHHILFGSPPTPCPLVIKLARRLRRVAALLRSLVVLFTYVLCEGSLQARPIWNLSKKHSRRTWEAPICVSF